ncbi:YtxH domain-containing protein [Ferruginibacter lapsinanis]|uniref:YtxH domain-containing protein n=1 Tax=Ferruginibacter lapsinanis TaxID=563172 RepID=UPI001E3D3974|nr:YtxH domain-containing protein [Ferruginibacter lapsinanis]UEG48857.1 YtxH domain-containing protein [Ferruginibacter lapsinanis]
MKTYNKILIALGAGMAVGGLLGVLFAPDKGSETRRKISDARKKAADTIKEKIALGKEKMSDFKESIMDKMELADERR